MIPYPNISPVIFSLGPIQVRWYGMMYLVGFAVAYWMMRRLADRWSTTFRGDRIVDFLVYAAVGVVVGGRLGYTLFYNFHFYLQNPLEVLAIWHGGLSFHGGFIGVMISGYVFARRYNLSFYEVADLVVVPTPIGIGLGRIGNFINGELYGRPSEVPWCMVFPEGGPICRHPSQLYEALLEGLVLFLCMWFLAKKPRPSGVIFWSFVALYGLFRFFVEFARAPDEQLGFVIGAFSMGQLLSLPMCLVGLLMIYRRQGVG